MSTNALLACSDKFTKDIKNPFCGINTLLCQIIFMVIRIMDVT